MNRRRITDDERALFEQSFTETRPLRTDRLDVPEPRRPKQIVAGGSGIDGRTEERLRRGLLDPDVKLDLHGMTEDAAHRRLLVFLRGAQRQGCKLALVVTGKGRPLADDAPFDLELHAKSRGVLAAAVPRWLNEPEFAALIAGRRVAHKRHGGEGALYIYLRKGR